jgi:uncharacterized cupredoxin-like copper-binding protein
MNSRGKPLKGLDNILCLALAAIFLAACGGRAPQGEPVTVHIEMTEYAFSPASITLEVGQQATFELANTGQLQHELLIGREVLEEDNRPAGYRTDLFESAGVTPEVTVSAPPEETGAEHEEHGFVVVVPANATATLTFPVTAEMAGEWEIGCFEQEGVHYDAGMVGTLTVQP